MDENPYDPPQLGEPHPPARKRLPLPLWRKILSLILFVYATIYFVGAFKLALFMAFPQKYGTLSEPGTPLLGLVFCLSIGAVFLWSGLKISRRI